MYVHIYQRMKSGIHPKNCLYFIFDHPDTYRLILITRHDHADLYISTYHKYVSYHNIMNIIHSSCTCGIDEI